MSDPASHNKTAMRVLHSAALLSPSSGMLAQMGYELGAAKALGLNWQVAMYCPRNIEGNDVVVNDQAVITDLSGGSFRKLIAWIKLRYNYHRWLLAQQDEIDVFMLRYYVHDPFQLWFVKRCQKPVFFVHHTLEMLELETAGGAFSRIRAQLERAIGRVSVRNATGIIGVTNEIVDYELNRSKGMTKPAYVYPNGITYVNTIIQDYRCKKHPELLFVANFSAWHGLDLLLESVSESSDQFTLHLVGNVPQSLLSLANDPRIKMHGSLDSGQIAGLSRQCWVGLASLAMFRNKMNQACPLKVREYLMLGLPVYAGYQDVFPDCFPFFRAGACDIREMLLFANDARKHDKVEVSSLSKPFIDKISLLDNMADELLKRKNR